MTLKSKIRINLTGEDTRDIGIAEDVTVPFLFQVNDSLTDGTAINKADKIWSVLNHTIAASGTYALDLDALTDNFGDSLTFTEIRAIAKANIAGQTGSPSIKVTSSSVAASVMLTGTTDGVKLPGGASHNSVLIWYVPEDATDYSGETITITNLDGANAAKVSIWIIGTSA